MDDGIADTGSFRVERRRDLRVAARASVIVSGGEPARGRLSNISSGGMSVILAGPPSHAVGDSLTIELHLDRAGATWLSFQGDVVRVEANELAIRLTAAPLELADIIQDAIVSAMKGETMAHVLLVDADHERRTPFAAILRRGGCHVAEAATPLEAIAHLGGSPIGRWVVAVADTSPRSVAHELRRFLSETSPDIEVRRLSKGSPTSALSWFTATTRAMVE